MIFPPVYFTGGLVDCQPSIGKIMVFDLYKFFSVKFIYSLLSMLAMNVGGQAVIEGVMMRNKEKYAVAVRLKSGKIKVKQEKNTAYPKIFQVFFIRGVVGLFFTLYDGLRALAWSSNQQLEKEEKLTKKEVIGTVLLSFLFALLIFVAVPFFGARFIH